VYPFGFGLSYSQFSYGDLTLSKNQMNSNDSIIASITVVNTSKRDGAEVVQFYIRDLVGSVTRPVMELKGFEKVMIKAGETKTITFKITNDQLSFYRQDLSYGSEPGKFQLFVGGNSRDVKLAEFELR
jgi:beta-glucosidase